MAVRSENTELYESIAEVQMYEVPSTSLTRDQKQSTEHNYHVLEAAVGRGAGRSDYYQVMEPPWLSAALQQQRGEGEGEGKEEHDYHVLEAPRTLGGGMERQCDHSSSLDKPRTARPLMVSEHIPSTDDHESVNRA